MRPARLLRHLLLGMLMLPPLAKAETVEVYALQAMPYCGSIDGHPAGLAIEILQAATRYGAPEFHFRFDVPWRRAQEMIQLQGNELSGIIPFSRTPQRETSYRWLAKLFMTQSHFYSYQLPHPIASVDEARGLEIGLVRGHALISELQALGFSLLDIGAANAGTNVRKLYYKRIASIADSDLIVRYYWKTMGYPENALQKGAAIGPPTGVYLAAGLHFPNDTEQRIQKAFVRLQSSGELEQILARW
jgi:polar amino acid transport system substrate-binding protein